ncbi:MAG: cysteine hydrolase family protein [Terriglobia bacterium]
MNSDWAFVDIDTQYDFMMPDGRLYVPGAELRIPNLKRLTELAIQHGVPLLSSLDAHTPDDPEFQQFPAHCVTGTPGQRKIAETLGRKPLVVSDAPSAWRAVERAESDQIILEKQKFDIFSNPWVEVLIAKMKGRRFVVYGVATDYCVKAAVLGLLERGNAVLLVEDAVAAVAPESGAAALEMMRSRGTEWVTTEGILNELGTPGLSARA